MGVRHILLTVHYRSTTVGGSEGFHVKLFIYDFTHKTGPLLQVSLRAETRDKGRNTLSDHAPDTPHTLGCSLPKTHAVILPHHWNQHSLPHAHARVFNPSLFISNPSQTEGTFSLASICQSWATTQANTDMQCAQTRPDRTIIRCYFKIDNGRWWQAGKRRKSRRLQARALSFSSWYPQPQMRLSLKKHLAEWCSLHQQLIGLPPRQKYCFLGEKGVRRCILHVHTHLWHNGLLSRFQRQMWNQGSHRKASPHIPD